MLAAQQAGAYLSLPGAAEEPAAVLRKQFAGKLPPPLAADNERILGALEQIARLRMPVPIVQGSTDIQVDAGQAQALKAARPDAALVLIPGMNHVLKEVPLHPQLLPAIAGFLTTALPRP